MRVGNVPLPTLRGVGDGERLAEGAGEVVGVLELGELDGESLIVVPNHAAAQAAEDDLGLNRRLDLRRHRGAAQRHVDDPAGMHVAVGQDQLGVGDARDEALVPPLLRQAEALLVGEPGEEVGDPLALVGTCRDAGGEAAVDGPHHDALDAAEIVEIGYDALADRR